MIFRRLFILLFAVSLLSLPSLAQEAALLSQSRA